MESILERYEQIERYKNFFKNFNNNIKQTNMKNFKDYQQGFIYTYTKGNELISGIIEKIARHGERFWCREVDPHGNAINWNYSKYDLDRIVN